MTIFLLDFFCVTELSKICATFKPQLFKLSLDGKTRKRCSFSHIQVCTLEKEFRIHRYLTSEQRAKLASTLNLTEQQVLQLIVYL